MTDHHWHDDPYVPDDHGGHDLPPDDHHDDLLHDDHHDEPHHDDLPPLPHHDDDAVHHDEGYEPAHEPGPHDTEPHTADHTADLTGDTDPTEFPPELHLGPLPEPVDGFPWIDTTSLGPDHDTTTPTTEPVDPHELAAYAATDIPPGADPWDTLTHSDDPATAALARWWAENPQ